MVIFEPFEQPGTQTDWVGYHKPIMVAGGFGPYSCNARGKIRSYGWDMSSRVRWTGDVNWFGGGAPRPLCSKAQGESQLDFASVQRDNAEIERRAQQVINSCWALAEEKPHYLHP